jgi:glutathione S-transferase
MYTLYGRPGSGSFVVEAALVLAGVPFNVVNVVKGAPPSGYSGISPLHQVPALGLPDGGSMTESAAMCLYLSDLHPEASLGPAPAAPARPEFLRWMLFLSSMLYPASLRFAYAQRYTTDPAGVAAVKGSALAESDRGFVIVEDALAGRDWLVGNQRSIADIYLLMLAYWHPVGDRPREEWTNITRLCRTLRADPVLAKLNETHRLW